MVFPVIDMAATGRTIKALREHNGYSVQDVQEYFGFDQPQAIQKNETVVDRIGNRTSAWEDFFSCWATATRSGKSAEETQNAGYTQEADRLDITVRWSSETAAVNSKQYRIMLDGRIYDILGIDEMGFRHNSRKFFCRLSER